VVPALAVIPAPGLRNASKPSCVMHLGVAEHLHLFGAGPPPKIAGSNAFFNKGEHEYPTTGYSDCRLVVVWLSGADARIGYCTAAADDRGETPAVGPGLLSPIYPRSPADGYVPYEAAADRWRKLKRRLRAGQRPLSRCSANCGCGRRSRTGRRKIQR